MSEVLRERALAWVKRVRERPSEPTGDLANALYLIEQLAATGAQKPSEPATSFCPECGFREAS